MEDNLVKIAIRHILVTLAWVGLLLGHRAWADDWAASRRESAGQVYEVVPPGATTASAADSNPSAIGGHFQPTAGTNATTADSDPSIIGEHQMPIGGVFGDGIGPACELCGGGNCLPSAWSVEPSVAVIAMSRAGNQRLGANSLPAGPLSAGSVVVTNSGLQTQVNYSQYLNDAVQQSMLEVHTPGLIVSPAMGLTIDRFLGRDGEGRDHFLEFAFNGLQSYSSLADTVHGSIIPFYDTAPFVQAIPAPPPTVLYYQGSLVSPYPIYLALNGAQQQLIAPSFSHFGLLYDAAFNRSDTMSTNYVTNYNECELNYRFDGHNQPDQVVMNPNGRWYRQCQTGYYYSYFFGMKVMVIDEDFSFFSSGSQYAAINNGNGTYSPGALVYTHQGSYGVHTSNTMLGFQTGGKLEYRFCRWCMDAHGNAGMFLNIARQDSSIQTSFGGPTPPTLADGTVAGASPQDANQSFGASSNVVAFAGGFGVAGSYKFRPNLVGRVSYDLTWVGDIARAPEQMVFSSVPETAQDYINTKGSVFYNGVSFGLELDW